MITYAILAGVVFNWDYTRFIRTFGRQIKSGDVAVFLLKPVRYPLMLLAGECGNLAFELLSVQLPVTIIAGLVYGLTPPASLFAGAMTIVFWGMGFVILFLLSAAAAILAFWLLTVFSLEWTLMALTAIFAGGHTSAVVFPACRVRHHSAVAILIRRLPPNGGVSRQARRGCHTRDPWPRRGLDRRPNWVCRASVVARTEPHRRARRLR